MLSDDEILADMYVQYSASKTNRLFFFNSLHSQLVLHWNNQQQTNKQLSFCIINDNSTYSQHVHVFKFSHAKDIHSNIIKQSEWCRISVKYRHHKCMRQLGLLRRARILLVSKILQILN